MKKAYFKLSPSLAIIIFFLMLFWISFLSFSPAQAAVNTLVTNGSTQIGSFTAGYFGYTNTSWRINTGNVDNAVVTAISSNFSGPANATLDDETGWTKVISSSYDDNNVQIPFGSGFNTSFNGIEYSSVYVSSNTYLTFGSGSSAYSNLSASVPNLPGVHIGSADNSFQKVLYKFDDPSTVRVRYEGNDSTQGRVGYPRIIYEAVFYKDQSYFDLYIGINYINSTGLGTATISGIPTVGNILAGTAPSWVDPGSLVFTYQWQRFDSGLNTWTNINGATSQNYTLTGSDSDKHVRLSLTATHGADNVTVVSYPLFIHTAATLYFNAASDHFWNNSNNWWLDEGCTIPAGFIPTIIDDVIISAYVYSNGGPSTSVKTMTVNGASTYIGLSVTVSDHAIFNDSSYNNGTITGTAIFSYAHGGIITVPDGGVWGSGTATSNRGDDNQVITTWIFNGSSYNYGTVTGNATFNNTSYNTGYGSGNYNARVTGNATFNNASFNNGIVSGNAIFSYAHGGVITIPDGGRWGRGTATSNRGDDNQAITSWIFSGTSYNYGIITGNATFNNTSNNYGDSNYKATITGNATFNNASFNNGTITGNAIFNFAHAGVITIAEGGRWGSGTAASYLGDDTQPITSWIFNGNSYNAATITGGVTFNSSSYNGGDITGEVAFKDNSYNDSTITGETIFSNSSSNTGTITGNTTFNNSSRNNKGTVDGNATFNDSSYNYGTITGDATFSNTSYNNGTVNGNATFNFAHAGVITIAEGGRWGNGTAASYLGDDTQPITSWIFNGNSYNDGNITGNATFNNTSHNEGAINGDAAFNDSSRNREVSGTEAIAREKIMYIGGTNDDYDTVEDIYTYDPDVDTWDTYESLPEARHRAITQVVNDWIYVIGGRNSDWDETKTNIAIDTHGGSWQNKAEVPFEIMSAGSGVISGKIYVAGGTGGSSDSDNAFDSLISYDPETDQWENLAPMDIGKHTPVSGVIDGKLYVVGGRAPDDNATNSLEVYDPQTNVWTTGTSMNTARIGAAGGAYNGKLYVVGGTQEECGSVSETTMEVYDPETNTWQYMASAPAVKLTSATAKFLDGKMYVMGGQTDCDNPFSDALLIYDIASDTWTPGSPMPANRAGGSSVVFTDRSAENNGTINGTATFNGNSSESNGIVNGTKIRRYTSDIVINRNFATTGPWTVMADGAVVNIYHATIDNIPGSPTFTTFQTLNGGSFDGNAGIIVTDPTPEKMAAEVAAGYISFQGDDPTATESFTFNMDFTLVSGNASVTFPAGTTVTNSQGGNLDLTQLATQIETALAESQLDDIAGAVHIGIPHLNLTFSSPITISIPVDSKYNGDTLQVLFQREDETQWNDETECDVENSLCTFTTTHATTFAAQEIPQNAVITSWKAEEYQKPDSSCSQRLKLTIKGKHFAKDAEVKIGGKEASSVEKKSSKEIVAKFCLTKLFNVKTDLERSVSVTNPDADKKTAKKKIDLANLNLKLTGDELNPQTPEGIKNIQRKLAQLNLLDPRYITGFYGPITATAVRKFQAQNNLPQTGTVGEETKAKLAGK